MHQLLGKHRGTRDLCPHDYKGKFFYDSDHDELRCIVDVTHQNEECVAITLRCDENGRRARARRTSDAGPVAKAARRRRRGGVDEREKDGERAAERVAHA